MKIKTDIVIVGSGAGGATLAKELAGKGRKVLVVERGPLPAPLGSMRSALFRNYDRCALRTSKEGVVIYRSLIAGGTTVISCGNGIRVLYDELRGFGIDLSRELDEAEKDLGIAPLADKCIGPGSSLIMDRANRLGFEMRPMPKFINARKCVLCGRCVLGCRYGAKWSALDFLEEAAASGVTVLTGVECRSVVSHNGRAIGIAAVGKEGKIRISADRVVLAAGGIGSPAILRRSGFEEAGNKLFVDLFNVTYGFMPGRNIDLWKEPSMALVSVKFRKSNGFVMAPYLDPPLSLRWLLPKKKMVKIFRYRNLLGIMAKIKDDNRGRVTSEEGIFKATSKLDDKKLKEGADMAKRILMECGVKRGNIIFTKPRSAHPGGSCAIGDIVDSDLKTRINGLYVCDASVLPESPGAPPILTIVALAKRLARAMA